MSFNPSIPQIGDFLAVSQKQILANYLAIYNAFQQNHAPLASFDQGYHTSFTLRSQAVDPTTLAGQAALYNKLVAGVPQLFFRPDTNQTPIQMSNSNMKIVSPGNQYSFVAGPFTIYMGFIANCPNTHIVTLTPASTILSVGLTIDQKLPNTPVFGNAVPLNINTPASSFTIQLVNNTQNNNVYYTAIGQ